MGKASSRGVGTAGGGCVCKCVRKGVGKGWGKGTVRDLRRNLPVSSRGWKRKMAQNLSPDPGLQLNKCSLSLSATFAWPGPHRPAGWARRKRLLVSTSSPLSLSLTHSTFSCLSSFLPRLPSSSASHRVRLRAPHFLTPSYFLRPLRPAHLPLPPPSLSGPLGRPIHHTPFSYQREGGFRESRRVGGEVREADRQIDEAGRYVGWVGVVGG